MNKKFVYQVGNNKKVIFFSVHLRAVDSLRGAALMKVSVMSHSSTSCKKAPMCQKRDRRLVEGIRIFSSSGRGHIVRGWRVRTGIECISSGRRDLWADVHDSGHSMSVAGLACVVEYSGCWSQHISTAEVRLLVWRLKQWISAE